MEKKTKKLQLRKETIAVLNGECMSHLIGGMDLKQCVMDGKMYNIGSVVYKDGYQYVCMTDGLWQRGDIPGSDTLCTLQTNCGQATCKPTICHICI